MAPENVGKTQAVNQPNYYQYPTNHTQMYANTAMMSDFTDDTFIGLNALGGAGYMSNPYSMSGSIFGGDFMGGGFGGYGGYGYNQELMRMSPKERMEYMADMEDYQIQRQIQRRKTMDAANFQVQAADDVITRQIGNLQSVVGRNEQDYVMTEYGKLTNAIRNKFKEAGYTNVPEEQIKAHAEKLYYETTGKSLLNDVQENGHSSFVTGLVDVFGFGLGNEKSASQNIANITGQSETKAEKGWRWVGKITAGLIAGAGIILGGKGAKTLIARGRP